MLDGIYSITFRGAVDWGSGLILLRRGLVTGADIGGVTYDGSYKEEGDTVHLDVQMTVPPGATLVQGSRPQPQPYQVPVNVSFPARVLTSSEPILFQLPPGPVNVIFRRLKEIQD